MGLKESGLRGSLRNVSVGIDAIPDSVVEDFEQYEPAGTDTLQDNYDSDDEFGRWDIETTNPLEGDQSLHTDGFSINHRLVSTSGLTDYPERGDSMACLFRPIDDGLNPTGAIIFGAQDLDNFYFVELSSPSFSIRIMENDSQTTLEEDDETGFELDQTYDINIDWNENDEIVATLFEWDGEERGQELTSISTTESTFANETGIGFAPGGTSGDRLFDSFRST